MSSCDTLPTTLAELSTFPVAFRKVIVNAVSPEQRRRFWEEHLRTFLEPQAGLTVEQRALVAEAVPLLRDIFEGPMPEARATMRSLEQRMGMVGPPEPPEGLPLPAGTRLTPIN